MKHLDTIIIVEHVVRELDLSQRIKRQLEAKGRSCKILSYRFHVHELLKYKADVYILPFGASIWDWPIFLILNRNPNAQIINLNYEQELHEENKRIKAPKDYYTTHIMKHCCWSESFIDLLDEAGVPKKNQIKVSNYNDELVATCKQSSIGDEIKTAFNLIEKPVIFMPMNYTAFFLKDTYVKQKIRKGFDADNAQLFADYTYQCFPHFLKFLTALLDSEKYHIVLRPHPYVTCEDYEKILDDNPYLTITKTYTTNDWLCAADMVISSWSSVVYDAQRHNIPSCLFTPIPRPDFFWMPWMACVHEISDINELVDVHENTKQSTPEYIEPSSTISSETIRILEKNQHVNFPITFGNILILKILKYLSASYLNNKMIKYRLLKRLVNNRYLDDYMPLQ